MGKRNKKARIKKRGKGKAADENIVDDYSEENTDAAPDSGEKVGSKFSVEQLLDKAEELIDSYEYDLAQQFCKRALETDSNNTRALEMTGTLLLELGDPDSAMQCFGRAIEIEPDKGHSKYMYMGQLLTGAEAISCFQKGIDLMTQEFEASQKEQVEAACATGKEKVTARILSDAHCSVAEIFLTDACFEDDAEKHCKLHLDKAIEHDSTNPEAYHLMASYFMSTEDPQTAKEMIKKGVSLWLPAMQDAEKPEGAEMDPVTPCSLSIPSRINAVKILVELQMYETASEILELLLDENDEVTEVWYMLGWTNHLQGEDYKENARFYLNKAKEDWRHSHHTCSIDAPHLVTLTHLKIHTGHNIFSQLLPQQVSSKVGCDDEQITEHITELLEELGPGEEGDGEPAGNPEDGDDDTMETDSEDEDEEAGNTSQQNTEEQMDH